MLLKQFSKLQEQAATSSGCGGAPFAIKGLSGSSNSDIDVLLRSLVDLADDGLIVRVDGIEGFAVNTRNKFVIDEPKIMVSCKIPMQFGAIFFSSRCREKKANTYKPVGCS